MGFGALVGCLNQRACFGSNADILARAYALGRAVLTYNRWHFERLHRQGHPHTGILSATRDSDFLALAARIDAALTGLPTGRWCVRVNRPP
jgi:hypothetical protein